MSGLMRHQIPLELLIKIVSDLHWQDKSLNTWKKGVTRALGKFIPDGTVSSSLCSKCNQKSLVYEEGCLNCKHCGYSKCK